MMFIRTITASILFAVYAHCAPSSDSERSFKLANNRGSSSEHELSRSSSVYSKSNSAENASDCAASIGSALSPELKSFIHENEMKESRDKSAMYVAEQYRSLVNTPWPEVDDTETSSLTQATPQTQEADQD